jgi:cytochrome c553
LWAVACSDPPVVPPDAEVLPSEMPDRLSLTGLYTDIRAKTLSPRLVEFTPKNVLWSDGAEKHRWFELPEGGQIDSSDMDHWKFPVGTKFFKEFALDGKRLETRLIWRVADTGNREKDTLVGAFLWNEAETDAVFAKDGGQNLRGTEHDAPAADTCWRCHVGEAGHALGLAALQIGDVSALPLSAPPAAGTTFAAPNSALGYLHANCGHCHNPEGGAWVDSHMILRLDVDERDATANQVVQSTVGADLEQWINHGYAKRIVAGDPDQSALYARISQRAMNVQMPPIATEKVDDAGVALIRAWIQSL